MDIRDLGPLTGDLLLFGGVYSNSHALDALLNWCKQNAISPEQMICTGDIVAYCANAAASIDRIRSVKIKSIAGNCEQQLAQGAQDCGCGFDAGSTCDLLSAGWFAHSDKTLDDDARLYMAGLPLWFVFTHCEKRYVVFHGGATAVNTFLWPSDPNSLFLKEINVIRAEVGPINGVISGHSGIAFSRIIDGVQWMNAGAIGLPPHDGRSETRFAVLSEGDIVFHRLEYDFEAAQSDMVNAGLVQGYNETLATGIWPSEDVLPKSLRR